MIGLGALAGVPPLAGFWSKDGVLAAAEAAALDGTGPAPAWVGWLVWIAGLLGVAVTAWYATRLLLRTFFGAAPAAAARGPHDPPALMRWPVLLLAVPAALLGLAGFVARSPTGCGSAPRRWRAPRSLVHLGADAAAAAGAAAGRRGAGLWLAGGGTRPPTRRRALGPLRPVFARAFRLDDVQDTLVVRPVRALARAGAHR